MVIAVESWTFPTDGDEEPVEEEMVESKDFDDEKDAKLWAWQKLEEGFFVRIWRR